MYIGVDGGGSKTALILIDAEGNVRATHLTSSAYYLTIGLDALNSLLESSISKLLEKARLSVSDVDFAFLGLPAYGEDAAATQAMSQLPARYLDADSYLCGNDMICGWAGSLACEDGINIVAGTGSICYGEHDGVTARCGGWGELFSDEGSAYWIACRGLDLFARMSDGRAAVGPLHALVRERLALANDLDVCGHVYETLAGDRTCIAQLCPLVFEARARGDAGAAAIIDLAASELALMVHSTRTRLGFRSDEHIPVSYSGGVFDNAGVSLISAFRAALEAHGLYRLQEPEFPPVIGAALYAARQHGQPLADIALDRLRAQKNDVIGALRS